MNDEEKYFYLAALDYRLFQESAGVLRAQELRDLVYESHDFSCPLCDAYWIQYTIESCKDCPASQESGDGFCWKWSESDLAEQRNRVARRKGLWVK